ncbi:peptide chain release factor N(5)-glutamine methyltransferase [Agrococcus sp. ARC_14]|uniref:peptide chain release factor N(5)-glutamine methyltransferase n=1 Tax=Agrococcus sp. ARC_14 TaxID=2919927 RepID=UPI001F057EC6|nr:peptide chain release factor N(5)-glutamine methyltransferase [Agrococcus sp. ARC_14]MCH1883699.1 peptide chain release factor N(5)-glutamine methyltransferase [Agrococcus sp. ARC_14]
MQQAVADVVRDARGRLAAVGIDGPDAELLAAWAAGSSLGELRVDMAMGRAFEADALARFLAAVARREGREPLQHITGLAPFRHVELAVGPGVFTPRPETELLVEVALEHLRRRVGTALVLDVGTGTGAVAIAIARESDARVIAVEASPAAYVWARRNLDALSPETVLLHADARDVAALAAVGIVPGSLAALVSNPPYVPHASVPADHEVRDFDPAAALYSGADGLDFIRDLVSLAADLVEPTGLVAFEHTEEQGPAVRAMLEDAGFRDARTRQDLTGRDRVTAAIR